MTDKSVATPRSIPENYYSNYLGRYVLELCDRYNKSLTDVAHRLHCGRPTLYAFVTGRRKYIDSTILDRLGAVFPNVDMDNVRRLEKMDEEENVRRRPGVKVIKKWNKTGSVVTPEKVIGAPVGVDSVSRIKLALWDTLDGSLTLSTARSILETMLDAMTSPTSEKK
ncbi:MAG: hypothetical protein WC444_04400 [Candidatus Paceibacterota bacterium]